MPAATAAARRDGGLLAFTRVTTRAHSSKTVKRATVAAAAVKLPFSPCAAQQRRGKEKCGRRVALIRKRLDRRARAFDRELRERQLTISDELSRGPPTGR